MAAAGEELLLHFHHLKESILKVKSLAGAHIFLWTQGGSPLCWTRPRM